MEDLLPLFHLALHPNSSTSMFWNSKRKPWSSSSHVLVMVLSEHSYLISDGSPVNIIGLFPTINDIVKVGQCLPIKLVVHSHCVPKMLSTLPSSTAKKSAMLVNSGNFTSILSHDLLPPRSDPSPIVTLKAVPSTIASSNSSTKVW